MSSRSLTKTALDEGEISAVSLCIDRIDAVKRLIDAIDGPACDGIPFYLLRRPKSPHRHPRVPWRQQVSAQPLQSPLASRRRPLYTRVLRRKALKRRRRRRADGYTLGACVASPLCARRRWFVPLHRWHAKRFFMCRRLGFATPSGNAAVASRLAGKGHRSIYKLWTRQGVALCCDVTVFFMSSIADGANPTTFSELDCSLPSNLQSTVVSVFLLCQSSTPSPGNSIPIASSQAPSHSTASIHQSYSSNSGVAFAPFHCAECAARAPAFIQRAVLSAACTSADCIEVRVLNVCRPSPGWLIIISTYKSLQRSGVSDHAAGLTSAAVWRNLTQSRRGAGAAAQELSTSKEILSSAELVASVSRTHPSMVPVGLTEMNQLAVVLGSLPLLPQIPSWLRSPRASRASDPSPHSAADSSTNASRASDPSPHSAADSSTNDYWVCSLCRSLACVPLHGYVVAAQSGALTAGSVLLAPGPDHSIGGFSPLSSSSRGTPPFLGALVGAHYSEICGRSCGAALLPSCVVSDCQSSGWWTVASSSIIGAAHSKLPPDHPRILVSPVVANAAVNQPIGQPDDTYYTSLSDSVLSSLQSSESSADKCPSVSIARVGCSAPTAPTSQGMPGTIEAHLVLSGLRYFDNGGYWAV